MDRYDQEVERLTRNPSKIEDSWSMSEPLFDFCTISRSGTTRPDGRLCGCLTFVRKNSTFGGYAWTDELTDAIQNDARLPFNAEDIRPKHLPVFAEWQRRIDRELGRTPPPLLPRLEDKDYPSESAYRASIQATEPDHLEFPQTRKD